jgi:hypothetical protein
MARFCCCINDKLVDFLICVDGLLLVRFRKYVTCLYDVTTCSDSGSVVTFVFSMLLLQWQMPSLGARRSCFSAAAPGSGGAIGSSRGNAKQRLLYFEKKPINICVENISIRKQYP